MKQGRCRKCKYVYTWDKDVNSTKHDLICIQCYGLLDRTAIPGSIEIRSRILHLSKPPIYQPNPPKETPDA